MILERIGVVRSPVTEGIDEGWGSVTSEVVIDEGYASGLTGLNAFSHILVVFYMHRYTFDADSDLVRRPQGRPDMPEVGIFAQRAKHRPNPIGVTAVGLVSVEVNVLTVRGLDAIDGTPRARPGPRPRPAARPRGGAGSSPRRGAAAGEGDHGDLRRGVHGDVQRDH